MLKNHDQCQDAHIHKIAQNAGKQAHVQCFHHKIQSAKYCQTDKDIGGNSSADQIIDLVDDNGHQHNIQHIKKSKPQEVQVERLHLHEVKIFL